MVAGLNDILLLLNICLYLCIFREINSLPSINDALSVLLGMKFNYFISV